MNFSNRQRFRWLIIGLLLLFWWRLLSAANEQAVTFDEIIHILHGAMFWQSWQLYSVVQNPPLVNAIIGLPIHLLYRPHLPPVNPEVLFVDWLTVSQQFMWRLNSNGLQLIWAARLGIMVLSLLLGALAARFARALFQRRWAGLMALFLLSFDPNVLAHGFLATTDLGMSFFLLLAVYAVWHYWERAPGKMGWWLTAVAIGLAFSAKFSAVILIPALYTITLFRMVSIHSSRREVILALLTVTGWIIVGGMILLLAYRGQLAPLLLDFAIQQEHQLTGHSAFFHGDVRVGGWWYYFPVAFAIKTPLGTLLLVFLALAVFVWRRGWRNWSAIWLLLPATAVFGAGLVSNVNIGYRYLLPMLPLLFVFTSHLTRMDYIVNSARRPILRLCLALLLGAVALASISIHPNYLAFFNQSIGGPANGWRWLVDSNLDWGQDLVALARYEAENLSRPYQIAWLGTAPLSAYGITRGQPMAVWPLGREDPLTDSFYPAAPAPGKYVLSATQLQGVYLQDSSKFQWFRERSAVDRIGYSLFVYDVSATGHAVGLALSGLGPMMIAPGDYETAFQSNDVQMRWFDARTALLWPGGGEASVWTAVADGYAPTHPLLASLYPPGSPIITGTHLLKETQWQYNLTHWETSPLAIVAEGKTAVFDNTLAFHGSKILVKDQSIEMLSAWRVLQTPTTPLKIFVHLLDNDGNLIAQHDGLDVGLSYLQTNDEFVQLHGISLPPSLPSGTYTLKIGLYRPNDLVRLTTIIDGVQTDGIVLQSINLPLSP